MCAFAGYGVANFVPLGTVWCYKIGCRMYVMPYRYELADEHCGGGGRNGSLLHCGCRLDREYAKAYAKNEQRISKE